MLYFRGFYHFKGLKWQTKIGLGWTVFRGPGLGRPRWLRVVGAAIAITSLSLLPPLDRQRGWGLGASRGPPSRPPRTLARACSGIEGPFHVPCPTVVCFRESLFLRPGSAVIIVKGACVFG
jgi:hypothetical protein